MAKSADAFRTISEVAEWLDTPAHVLRFWESKFPQVKPVKRAGGRRYYRPSDMQLLGGIKQLLHNDGMTIKGVQKLLREQGVRHVAGHSPALGGDETGPQPDDITATAIETTPQEEPRGRLLTFPAAGEAAQPGAASAEDSGAADEVKATETTPDAPETPEVEAVDARPAPPTSGTGEDGTPQETAPDPGEDTADEAPRAPETAATARTSPDAPPPPESAEDATDAPAPDAGTGAEEAAPAAPSDLPGFLRASAADTPGLDTGSDTDADAPPTEAPARRARAIDTPDDPGDDIAAPAGLLSLLPGARMPIEDAQAAELSALLSRLAALRSRMAGQHKE